MTRAMTHHASTGAPSGDWQREVETGSRYEFGANWASFLRNLNPERVEAAEASLKQFLQVKDLHGKTFLDIGSGSGLFSLAARRLGAKVTSFDFDPNSVGCTAELRRRYFADDPNWSVQQGSVLDGDLLGRLPKFDIVYSWGVLHHTGAMWQALDNASTLVAARGKLFIAIYDDRGMRSRFWKRFKRLYINSPAPLKWALFVPAFAKIWGPTILRDSLKGKPLKSWKGYAGRGMDAWHDLLDWLGGYPFEVARPDEIIDFYEKRGFKLTKLKTSIGGCNEFVFARKAKRS